MNATPSTTDCAPRLAILFWFYDHIDVCVSRLDLLGRLNPGVAIYGLYGGPLTQAISFQDALSSRLDHFYAFQQDRPPSWKWEHGDILISEWFRECGQGFDWDTIVVVQWDMLVLKPVRQVFSGLRVNEIYISSTRPVKEIEDSWHWVTASNEPLRRRYLQFLDALAEAYGHAVEPLASIFLVVCLPRIFLEQYSRIATPEAGFIEYRVPTYAKLFGIPFCDRLTLDAWLPEEQHTFTGTRKYLIPVKMSIPLPEIYLSQLLPSRPVIFHPYNRVFRPGLSGALRDAANLIRDARAFLRFRKRALASLCFGSRGRASD